MLPEPKNRKIGSRTNCMFIGYVEHSAAYRFLDWKSDILDCNTIVETRNAKFFEHIHPLSEENFHASVNRNTNESVDVTFNEELIRSKRARKEISFGDDCHLSYWCWPNHLLWYCLIF